MDDVNATVPGVAREAASLPPARPACDAATCPISKGPCPGECVFAQVMNSGNLAIVLLDTEARSVLFHNPAALELLDGVVAAGDYDAWHRLLVEPTGSPAESPVAPPPLRLGPRLVGYSLYRSGRFVWALLRDITEKARLEAIAEAVELMNSIGYVFATVRHELGNPVNSVKTALSVLRHNHERFSAQTRLDYVERCLAELERLEHLLASLKSFSVYEDLHLAEHELAPLLERTASLVSADFGARGIRVQVECDPGASRARFDPRALHQVLLNLLGNAADALEGCAERQIRVSTFALGGAVGLRVEDTGCGLTEAQMQLLFKPFASSKPAGTGLGLVIAKKTLARMGGTIEVASRPQGGALVTLTLPRANRPSVRAADAPWIEGDHAWPTSAASRQ